MTVRVLNSPSLYVAPRYFAIHSSTKILVISKPPFAHPIPVRTFTVAKKGCKEKESFPLHATTFFSVPLGSFFRAFSVHKVFVLTVSSGPRILASISQSRVNRGY